MPVLPLLNLVAPDGEGCRYQGYSKDPGMMSTANPTKLIA